MRDSPWTEEAIATLRAGWAAGDSCLVISRKIGISRNSVISKAHRLKLGKRVSPIRPAGSGGERAARRFANREAKKAGGVAAAVLNAEAKPAVPAATLPELAPAPPRASSLTCSYPIGEPGTWGFHFCTAPITTAKRSYCDDHHAICWTPRSQAAKTADAPSR